MKNRITNILICLAFVAAICLACRALTWFMVTKQPCNIFQMPAFRAQDPGSIDVLFIGSSRVFNDIYPDVLYENEGIAGFDLASPAQLPETSYYMLREALRTQSPKVVVLEISQIDDGRAYTEKGEDGRFIQNGLRFFKYRLEDRLAGVDPGDGEEPFEFPGYLYLLPIYHGNYEGATKEDSIYLEHAPYPESGLQGDKGAFPHYHKESQGPFPGQMTPREDPLSDRELYYLNKIDETCRNAGIDLLLINSPDHDLFDYPHFEAWAKEKGVPFINYNKLYDETEIAPDEDFIDTGHLNRYGGVKYSAHLAGYLKANYDLPDHRGEEKYASWRENAAYEHLKEKNMLLPKITGLGDYFSQLPCEDYVVILTLAGDYDSEQVGQRDVLKNLGIDETTYRAGGTWVFKGCDAILFYSPAQEFDWHTDLGRRTLEIRQGEERRVLIDGEDYAYKKESERCVTDGLDLIIYDLKSQTVVDSVAFDASNGWAATR